MRHSHEFENHYCTSCNQTYRHQNAGNQTTCLRCGSVKVIGHMRGHPPKDNQHVHGERKEEGADPPAR